MSAAAQNTQFNVLLAGSALVLSALLVVLVVYVARYRRGRATTGPAVPSTRKPWLQLAWTVVPALVLAGLFAWGFRSYAESSLPPANAMEVRVTARQYSWSFTYPRLGCSSARLVVPVNTPVRLTMSSSDVIHGFFVPAFHIQHDVLPQRFSVVWFKAAQVGEFDVLCSEYCGPGHALMHTTIEVRDQDGFEAFANSYCETAGLDTVGIGRRLFHEILHCDRCHGTEPSAFPTVGPNLYGIAGSEMELGDETTIEVDRAFLRESIFDHSESVARRPGRHFTAGVMPSFALELNEEQLGAIVDYIKSLREQ